MPDFRSTITPYICAKDASAAIEFYKAAFGATETMRMTDPEGVIGHAELDINGATVMLSDEFPGMGVLSPSSLGGTPIAMMLMVENVDAFAARAVGAGATLSRPIENQEHGHRSGWLLDPHGFRWYIAQAVESVSNEQLQERVGDTYRVE